MGGRSTLNVRPNFRSLRHVIFLIHAGQEQSGCEAGAALAITSSPRQRSLSGEASNARWGDIVLSYLTPAIWKCGCASPQFRISLTCAASLRRFIAYTRG